MVADEGTAPMLGQQLQASHFVKRPCPVRDTPSAFMPASITDRTPSTMWAFTWPMWPIRKKSA
jgi:hypothetical protein